MMRRLLGFIFLLLGTLVAGCGKQQSQTDNHSQIPTTVTVDRLVKEGEHLGGQLTVNGVVRSASPSDGILTLVDTEEYETCGLSDCSLFLPVRWKGNMPGVESKVSITGSIDKTPDGLVFVASSVTTATPSKN